MDKETSRDLAANPASLLRRDIETALAASGVMDNERFAHFLDHQRKVGLVHGPRPLCRHLAPLIVGAARFNEIARTATLVASALGKVAARALTDHAMAAELGLTPQEMELIAIEPGYPQALAVGRLDMLVSDEGFHFIELNADSPAGLVDQLLLRETQLALPVLARPLARPKLRTPTPHLALVNALEQISASWRGKFGLPPASALSIAIVDWVGVDTAAEIQRLVSVLHAAGHRAVFVDPGELYYDGRRLTARGQTFDLIYRRVITQELMERGGLEHPLVRAYRDGVVCVANSFRAKLFNKKAAFAVLSDPAFRALFSPEECQVIDAHVPWTRRVRPGPTRWRDRELDLYELLVSERENLVLKPNDEYGGKGVLLGWRTSADLWRDAIDTNRSGQPLIVQERKMPRPLLLPTYRDRHVVYEKVYTDLCPFLFADKVEGAVVRVSSSPMTNVSAGGGVTGLLIVDGEGTQALPHV